ncbi:acyl-CoA dehydrogenase family protein [Frankia sp. Cr1]|uniref:acyl-CoA dehydrogenase family protein n=1 Tax=Frankia sp. Cr1 TaxID=3073931 RepID=UPI002AD329B0|nr:acyl-CoA dehydrogenase family protein [Frankia sp. Cr1]
MTEVAPGDDEIGQFVALATAFLDRHAKRRPERLGQLGWGTGPDDIAVLEVHADADAEQRDLTAAQVWRATVFDAGFGWLGGPVEYGGGGRNPVLDDVYRGLESGYEVPNQNIIASGTALVAPAVIAHGSAEVKARYLRGVFRGDLVCCQLLSEPDAGSDLAGLHTRAVRDGDEWVVTGQKVWSSYAHLAHVGQLLARTDPDASRHAGLTMFLVDMDSPGVQVRPLRMMTGEAHFNEIFLDEVRIPDRHRVGAVGQGWQATITTLMSERAAVGGGATSPAMDPVHRVTALARQLGRAGDPLLRQRLADVHLHERLLRYLGLRQEAALAAGRPPGPEGSVMKLLYSQQARRIGELAADLLGPAVTADNGEWGTFAWARWVCGAPLLRIAGGTDEIQRNTLAERVLGLPRGPR